MKINPNEETTVLAKIIRKIVKEDRDANKNEFHNCIKLTKSKDDKLKFENPKHQNVVIQDL